MRIAVVHSFYSSRQPSGENAVVEDQVAALRAAGHDVRLVARRTDAVEAQRAYGPRAAARVATGRGWSPAKELSEFAPDVVHLHNTFPNIGTSWLGHWAPRTVVTLHNFRTVCAAGTLFRDGHPCRDCLETPVLPAVRHACYRGSKVASLPLAVAARPHGSLRRIGDQSAEVVVLNEQARDVLEPLFGRRVNVIPNFISAGQKHEAPHTGWLYVGRLSQEKGIVELLSSWPADERLDIVGAGPLDDEVQRRVEEMPALRHLGLLDRADLRARLGGYEGLILPSLWPEGLPTVVLEAMASGLPVVVSDRVASAQDFVDHGAATLLPAPFDRDRVRAALAVTRADDTMRQNALALHAARYSSEAWLKAVLPVYERAAGA